MSIQDEIFDVDWALRDKPERESFDRICAYLNSLEAELQEARAKIKENDQ